MKYHYFFLFIIILNLPVNAGLIINPRYDLIGNENIFWNRLMVSTQADFQIKSIRLYADLFAEQNFNELEGYNWRTVESKGYLQELFFEYSTDTLYLKIGRQANRWSDSWVLPSLDIWTARKYERLFVDPLAFQLSHSSGASLSITKSNLQLDLVAFTEVAEDTLPVILPQPKEERESFNPGARFKFDFKGIQNSFVIARALKKNLIGYSANYAFDNWVPKFEIGYKKNEQKSAIIYNEGSGFVSLGADIFIGRLTMTPQITIFNEENDLENSTQGLHYLSVLYTAGIHEIQLQEFANTYYKDLFYSAQYTITLKKRFSIGVLYQNYDGGIGTLTKFVNEKTKGDLFGLRLQFFADI